MPALYCSTSIALCSLEKIVHVGAGALPPLMLVAVDIPDGAAVYEPNAAALPPGWDLLPTSDAAQAFGGAWLEGGGELAMKIPSVLVKEEFNVILNPRHPSYSEVALTVIRPFAFDARLIK